MDYGTGPRSVGRTEGAFPELARALAGSTPIVAHGRPYTPDFVGWMDDFSHTGGYDANGPLSRTPTPLNAFRPSVGSGAVPALLPLPDRADVLRSEEHTAEL